MNRLRRGVGAVIDAVPRVEGRSLFCFFPAIACFGRASGGVGEWLNPADCKSARIAYAGSNPAPSTISRFVAVFAPKSLTQNSALGSENDRQMFC